MQHLKQNRGKASKQRLGLGFLSKYGSFSVNIVPRQMVSTYDETPVKKTIC